MLDMKIQLHFCKTDTKETNLIKLKARDKIPCAKMSPDIWTLNYGEYYKII